MKGIILAGGKGTRLYPITKVVSKQLLPIYDKPMIYYPLSILMLAGIKEILIISTREDLPMYKKLLGNGKKIGLKLSYKVQEEPKGLAEAFIIGKDFIGDANVCLILGDNIFYGASLEEILSKASEEINGGLIFGYQVEDPKSFGVVEFDSQFNVLSLEEKPEVPKSNWAIPGIYFYDNSVVDVVKNIKPSKRGELEITTLNSEYLKEKKLSVVPLGRGVAWLDTGTPQGLNKASNFVEIIQSRQGLYISCIEEIAYRKKYISLDELEALGKELQTTEYGKYILNIVKNERKK